MTRRGFGILVGGQGSRLGGAAKGLLVRADGTSVVEHLAAVCRAVDPDAPLYLLGDREEYRALGLRLLRDEPASVGPMGGLHALLRQNYDEVVLLGCDLPYLSSGLLERLLSEPLDVALAAVRGTPPRWEPMCSRFRVQETLAVVRERLRSGHYGIASLLDRLQAKPLDLSEAETPQLDDWDTPDDVRRGEGRLPSTLPTPGFARQRGPRSGA